MTAQRWEKIKDVFDRFIEPVYRDLLAVHQNYMEMFEETLRLLPAEGRGAMQRDKELRRALNYLETNRRKLEPVRQKLRIVSRDLDGIKKKKGKKDEFIEAVVSYISWGGREGVGSLSMTVAWQIRMALRKQAGAPLAAEDVRAFVSRVMIGQRERFVQATEAYGKMLAKIAM